MNYLRRICCALVLLSLLSVSVVAGDQNTPPGKNPGEIDVPGKAASINDPGDIDVPGRNDPGEQETPGRRDPGELGTPGKKGGLQIRIGLVLWLVSLVR